MTMPEPLARNIHDALRANESTLKYFIHSHRSELQNINYKLGGERDTGSNGVPLTSAAGLIRIVVATAARLGGPGVI